MRRLFVLACLAWLGCQGPRGQDGHSHGDHGHAHDDHGHGHGDHGHGDHGHGDHGHGDHGHGGERTLTVWSDTYELFAEHPAPVVNEALPLRAHLTRLEGFRPLENARVRWTLRGPAELSAEADMLAPGIYRPVVTPTVPGRYQATLDILEGGEGRIGPFEIEVHASTPPSEHAHDDALPFAKEQQWRVPFATAFARALQIRPSVEVTGELTTPPGGMAHVHAPVAGRIIAPPDGLPIPGSGVEEGGLLATIAPTPGTPETAARANLAVVEAEARVEAGRTEVERTERMVESQAVPGRQLEEARRRLRVAEASLAAAQRVSSLFRSAQTGRGGGTWRITSPIDGILDAVDVSPGEAVDTEDRLFRVVDPAILWVTAEIPETWAGRFVRDADASFVVVGDRRSYPIALGEGASLVHQSRTVDVESRTVRVVYALDGPPETLHVGAAVRVLIPAGPPADTVTVPRSAVLNVEGRDVVYVQLAGESFEERTVRTGPRQGELVAIETGVEAGERVVSRGAQLLRLAGSEGSVNHGHGHVH